jgi:hypothetical protein
MQNYREELAGLAERVTQNYEVRVAITQPRRLSMLCCRPARSTSRLMNSKISDLITKFRILSRRRRKENLHNSLTQNAVSSDDKWETIVILTTPLPCVIRQAMYV